MLVEHWVRLRCGRRLSKRVYLLLYLDDRVAGFTFGIVLFELNLTTKMLNLRI